MFFGLAASLVAGALFVLHPLFREKPVRIRLAVGAQKALPLRGAGLRAIAGTPIVASVERDARGRLVVVGTKVGATDLKIFAEGRMIREFEVEVTPAPPRKIEVVAARPPKPKPRKRLPPAVAETVPPLPQELPLPEVQPPPPPPALTVKPPEKQVEAKKEEEKKTEEKPPAPRQPVPPKDPGKKMVELDLANKKKPKDAKYLAQEDSAVERETRAIDTTLIKTKPGKEQPDEPRRKDRPGDEKAELAEAEESARRKSEKRVALAPQETRPAVPPSAPPPEPRVAPESEPVPDTGPEGGDQIPGQRLRRFRLFPTARQIAEILKQLPPQGPKKSQEATAPDEGVDRRATRMPGGKWRGIWKRVTGFLENFVPEVQPGTHTALNARKHAFAAYIAQAHRRIHVQWGFGLWEHFRDLPDPAGRTPYESSIYARLEIKLDRQGKVTRLGLIRTSGHTAFDGGAMAAVLAAAPFGPPPEEMVSQDGSTYMHWNFYQDGRQCWTNDVQVYVRDS
jgi:TonB family protein